MSWSRQRIFWNQSCTSDDQYKCRRIYGIKGEEMEVIEGSRICGKTLGTSFVNAVRPSPSTKKCPTDYLPCSTYTSVDNTLCYRKTDERDKICPITEIKYKYFDTKE
jgi:hypothetical protein